MSIQLDTSKFVCLRDPKDGSTYYGELAYLEIATGEVVTEKDPSKKGAVDVEGNEAPVYARIR
jgi:hypothetical protein